MTLRVKFSVDKTLPSGSVIVAEIGLGPMRHTVHLTETQARDIYGDLGNAILALKPRARRDGGDVMTADGPRAL